MKPEDEAAYDRLHELYKGAYALRSGVIRKKIIDKRPVKDQIDDIMKDMPAIPHKAKGGKYVIDDKKKLVKIYVDYPQPKHTVNEKHALLVNYPEKQEMAHVTNYENKVFSALEIPLYNLGYSVKILSAKKMPATATIKPLHIDTSEHFVDTMVKAHEMFKKHGLETTKTLFKNLGFTKLDEDTWRSKSAPVPISLTSEGIKFLKKHK
jgi:hypothetical protein